MSKFFFHEQPVPCDAGWEALEDVPADLNRIMELYRQSGAPGATNDDVRPTSFASIEDFYATFDEFEGQKLFIGGDDEQECSQITAVANLDFRNGIAYCEGIAVDPSARGRGLGRYCLAHLVSVAQDAGAPELHLRAQQRVTDFYETIFGARYLDNAEYPLMAISID